MRGGRREVSEEAVERGWDPPEVHRVDQRPRVLGLAAGVRAHETPELLFDRSALLRRLTLKGAERSQLALDLDDLFDGGGAKGPDQFVLEVIDADVEAQSLEIAAREVGAESRPLERPPEVALLPRIGQSRKADVVPLRSKEMDERADGLGAADWHDGDAFGVQISIPATSQGLESDLVAEPLDDHNGPSA